MNNNATPLLQTVHGAVYPMSSGARVLLGFDGAWMALSREQLTGVGNTLANILNCPFKLHHLEAGMLLRSKDGAHRLPLTEESAKELHGLINDSLLLLEAVSALADAFPATAAE
ncbi:MAG: hypothetical protein AAB214_14610 [Fibrobacterota bacterium]